MTISKNPYGGGPGTGITLPDYYRPTKYVKNNNFYFPGTEDLGSDEMRISFVGSTPWPPRIGQAGTCIMVELGNGDNFFFDLGNGSIKNIMAMQVPVAIINDIFITHLHIDHYADLPYRLPFTAGTGRFNPLRVYGPSGRTSELGTQAMVDNMKKMMVWHLEAFDVFPIGDGYEVEVTEFDFKEENGICYDHNGVTVRHWPRSHAKDGASAYRLDWHDAGLSFVWTGDGRPDELTIKYSKGVDVFVSEVQNDLSFFNALTLALPEIVFNYTIDTHHTPHYALGYLFKEINPRIGMATHLEYEPELASELIAGIRQHWDGLFVMGAPDVKVLNVTKNNIWARDAVLPELGRSARPKPAQLMQVFGHKELPEEIAYPPARSSREEQQEQFLRDIEIDPDLYMPPDVSRDLITSLPPIVVNAKKFVGGKKDD